MNGWYGEIRFWDFSKMHSQVLKHSITRDLVSANVNLALAKQQLGHKSIHQPQSKPNILG